MELSAEEEDKLQRWVLFQASDEIAAAVAQGIPFDTSQGVQVVGVGDDAISYSQLEEQNSNKNVESFPELITGSLYNDLIGTRQAEEDEQQRQQDAEDEQTQMDAEAEAEAERIRETADRLQITPQQTADLLDALMYVNEISEAEVEREELISSGQLSKDDEADKPVYSVPDYLMTRLTELQERLLKVGEAAAAENVKARLAFAKDLLAKGMLQEVDPDVLQQQLEHAEQLAAEEDEEAEADEAAMEE